MSAIRQYTAPLTPLSVPVPYFAAASYHLRPMTTHLERGQPSTLQSDDNLLLLTSKAERLHLYWWPDTLGYLQAAKEGFWALFEACDLRAQVTCSCQNGTTLLRCI